MELVADRVTGRLGSELSCSSADAVIPALNDDGYLPPGVHPGSLDDVAARFGQEPELRRVQMESLRWLVELARRVDRHGNPKGMVQVVL